MVDEEKLPWELVDEILSRVPPTSLFRFRTVCKRWNVLFYDKTFMNNHKKTFRFILATESKIYSVSIDPKIEVCDLTLDFPGLEYQEPQYLVDCDKFLLYGLDKGAVVWNPWLRQSRWIESSEIKQTPMQFSGIGYVDRNYKILASCSPTGLPNKSWCKIYDFASDAWKDYGSGDGIEERSSYVTFGDSVSLNGIYHVRRRTLKDALVLGVFKGDRLSLLKQCHKTKKIEIWVTKYKVNTNLAREDVKWINFMEVSSPNLPSLVYYSQPSYFIEDKRLVVCSWDKIGRAWIYVLGENKLISKSHIDYVVDPWPFHCSFIPSLVPVPRGQREELAELQV
ncbi:F-box domain [Arabidopsis suecica]|uniref:F-box domain n=1 Tax=Arabidopsis suecica TaxID=45249 RepID=A0A8T1XWQ9_ARASU|nr:F-box domain [Arabidopsis suecica]